MSIPRRQNKPLTIWSLNNNIKEYKKEIRKLFNSLNSKSNIFCDIISQINNLKLKIINEEKKLKYLKNCEPINGYPEDYKVINFKHLRDGKESNKKTN